MPTLPIEGRSNAPGCGNPSGTDDDRDLGDMLVAAVDGGAYATDPVVQALLEDIACRHDEDGKVLAILMYGSYLRGKRDTLLDFYVLLENFRSTIDSRWQRLANQLLPPNVYYQHVQRADVDARAKYATMTLDQFERAMAGDFHSYFWSRFTQPCAVVYARDEQALQRVLQALQNAVSTFIGSVAPMLPERFGASELWQTGFALTYRAELRAESGARIAELYETHARHFDDLCSGYARRSDAAISRLADGAFRRLRPADRRRAARTWAVRRWQGKLLSALRIVKAAGTFDDPLDYLLWKIHRHSGIYIEPTATQRRFPLLFAWPLLWRLYRLGAFR